MFQRFALFVAALAAALVIAIGVTASTVPAQVRVAVAAGVASVQAQDPTPRIQIDTVYVPAPITPPTITVHRNVAPTAGGDDGAEGGND